MSGDARQALADFRAEGRALTGGGREDEAYNNALAKLAREALDQSHFGQQSGSEAGRIKLAFAAAADAQSKSEQEAESKAKARFNDAVLLAMLAQLEEEIKALEKQIDVYDKQIDAVNWLIANHKIIDPTDSAHMQLLELAGIPKDEWGTVTVEDLKERLEELFRERDGLNQKLDKSRQELADLNERHQKILVSEGPEKEAELAIVEAEYRTKIDDHAANYPDLLENEAAWFKTGLTIGRIEAPNYIDDILGMIEKLNPLSKKDLLEDDAVPNEIKDLLRLSVFDEMYESISKNSDKPNYEALLERALLPKLDDRTKELLVNRADTPKEILAMLEIDTEIVKLGVGSTPS